MSTKCTIGHGPDHHLYEECWENDHVYLELNDNFDIETKTRFGKPSAVVKIDVTLWRSIVQAWLESPWGKDESKDHKEFEIDFTALERMIEARKGNKESE